MNRDRDITDDGRDPREHKVLQAFDHVLAVDEPIPADIVRRAQELYVWRAVDAELLDLLVDSSLQELTAVRDDHLQRFMAFGSEERGVHFECIATSEGFVLEGMVVPDGSYAVRVDRPGGEVIVDTDAYGTFRVGGLESGSVRLTIRTPAGDIMMATPWFVLQE